MLIEWERHRAELVVKPGRITLTVDRLRTVDCDACGRLLRAVLGPDTFRRGYQHRYLHIRSEAIEGERFHVPQEMDGAGIAALHRDIKALTDAVWQAASETTREMLAPLRCWSVERLQADGDRCRKLLPNPGPVPPDQQYSLLLQPRCDRSPRVHLEAILDFLGPARAMRPTTWLDGPLSPDEVAQWLPYLPPQPVAAELIDADPVAGLTRAFLKLPLGTGPALEQFHQAGTAVSLLADAPVTASQAAALAEQVRDLPWQRGDVLYVREPVPYPSTPEARLAARHCFHLLRQSLGWAEEPRLSHFPTRQSIW
ncbi:MAG: hypothetical protein ACYCW6_04005 [Candidatus Xenobia bacterium]